MSEFSSRFKSSFSSPPGGWYEYAVGGEIIRDKSRTQISLKVLELRRRLGLPVEGEGFLYVMAYMCPRLPDGFCTKPSTVKTLKAEEVKMKTSGLFPMKVAPADVIEERLQKCVGCPSHVVRGFCMGCNGLMDWVYRGFRGRRGALPPDLGTGVCVPDLVLAAAGATVAARPLQEGAEYPAGCWRLTEKETANA